MVSWRRFPPSTGSRYYFPARSSRTVTALAALYSCTVRSNGSLLVWWAGPETYAGDGALKSTSWPFAAHSNTPVSQPFGHHSGLFSCFTSSATVGAPNP